MTGGKSSFTPDDFFRACDVSRETLDRLRVYAALLKKWQKSINLVSPQTVQDMWWRHFYDSAQLAALIPDRAGDLKILDIGSGAGFPGLVLSILGRGSVHLVESNSKKCAFLRQVIRETGARAEVHQSRIEDLPPFAVDYVTSRALAPLDRLLHWVVPFVTPQTICLFPKGQSAEAELKQAQKNWRFSLKKYTSRTEESAMILKLGKIRTLD
ncbi:16S rRNA (guanine(527)-N(7))-methyltransferase RsmG [Luteithermobacter gelatinilyticus]|uniref:16S rRNA (guanine(527)-N(7))-methyltransferase RsmG n=1 Tax=Luteithermobacter gelatinilyticus TaxID=2582913 RepID=UPI0011073AA9|nr:16S rRNA (guanine(527)-N(7))-methyltransferase RsmG [Luteithermobacter gelatinilyticus]